MDFKTFKELYQNAPVVEYPNKTGTKEAEVTIKLVTYNHVDYISECLDSLVDQKTNFDYQILIAEDGSTDGTRDICIEYADKYPEKIKLLLNSRSNNISVNGKPSGFFNSTYANYCVTSKYISIIEGDDYWSDNNSLQKRFDFLEQNLDYVMCYHGIRQYNQQLGSFEKDFLPFSESTTIESIRMIVTQMPTSSIMFRHGLIDLYDPGMENITCGDVVLRGKLCQFGKSRFLHDVGPSVYRKHRGGIHSTLATSEKYKEIIAARLYLLRYYDKKGWNPEPIHTSLSQNYLFHFLHFVKNKTSIEWTLLKKSYLHSRNSKESFFSLFSRIVIKPMFDKIFQKTKSYA